jgi:hypothetical protein
MTTRTEVIPPKHFSVLELGRAGVVVRSTSAIWLECRDCGQQWSPLLRPGGKLPRGYWRCPDGCNATD